MKNVITPIFALTILAAASCGNNDKKAAPAAPAKPGSQSIAIIDMDTIRSQYAFYKESKDKFESKGKAFQAELEKKQAALENMQRGIQTKMQQGKYTSEAQYKADVNRFNQQMQSFQQLQSSRSQDLAKEEERLTKAIKDSVDNFLAEYNKTKNFTVILDKQATLYAQPGMDITKEVVAGLNKRYKK